MNDGGVSAEAKAEAPLPLVNGTDGANEPETQEVRRNVKRD